MRRVGLVAAAFVAGLGAAALVLSLAIGAEADRAGRARYRHRGLLAKAAQAATMPPPRVVWLGDSTILDVPGVPSWATRLRDRLAAGGRASGVVVSWLGLSPFHYYCLMGPILETHPAAVVLVANMRMFGGHAFPFDDLCSGVPASELLHAVRLPFLARGLAWPQLLLLRGWRVPAIEAATYRVTGLRELADQAPLWAGLGPVAPPLAEEEVRPRYERAQHQLLAEYETPLDERQDGVRMLDAAARLATAAGSRVLVVVSPVPRHELEPRGLYDPARFAARLAVLRHVVEAAGGHFLDLHDALGPSEFGDRSGHLASAGAELVAGRVEPMLAAVLGARAAAD